MRARTLLALSVTAGALTVFCEGTSLQAQEDPESRLHDDREWLISAAVLALPSELRDGAEVRVRTDGPDLRTIREGDNSMICLADEPGGGFHVACYHESLEPFMRRGRELSAQGLEESERQRARWEDIEAGELSMPDHPTMVYNLTFDTEAIDPDTTDWRDGARLHATYIPYATPEQTGLTTESNPVEPWLMWPGEPSAHIMMVIPPRTAPGGGESGAGGG
ncbi:MAG: hypothetical protein ACOC5J_01315 [Gemmatimonadota bacterium]